MNPAAVAFLTVLLVFSAQGQSSDRSNGCKCLNGFMGRVNLSLIKAAPIVYKPNVFCPRTEIIITTTANKDKCVNPESPFGKYILGKINQQEKKEAVSTTTASSSTSLHTTSRLQPRRLH